jgi:hypothetical protein
MRHLIIAILAAPLLGACSARLAIVGTFEMVASNRFRELMSESNKGSRVRFAQSRDEALSWMMRQSQGPLHSTTATPLRLHKRS